MSPKVDKNQGNKNTQITITERHDSNKRSRTERFYFISDSEILNFQRRILLGQWMFKWWLIEIPAKKEVNLRQFLALLWWWPTFVSGEAALSAQVDNILAELTALQVGVGNQLHLTVRTFKRRKKYKINLYKLSYYRYSINKSRNQLNNE